jgi:hypothetical protein
MWRSTVLSLPPQLVFPAQSIWLVLKDCFNLLMLSSSWIWTRSPGKSYWEVRLSTVDLLVLTRLDQFVFKLKILFSFFIKQVALMWRSTVLSLLPQLVFLAKSHDLLLSALPTMLPALAKYILPWISGRIIEDCFYQLLSLVQSMSCIQTLNLN